MVPKLDCTGPCGDIVEFGCGYGTFTLAAARVTRGRLFALDIEPAMVAETLRKAHDSGLSNVVARIQDFVLEGCGVADGQAECAMLFNILQIEEPMRLLREAYRALAPGGKAGIIHWRNDIETPRGPSMRIRPTADQCRAWGEEAGLEFVRYETLCCCSWHGGWSCAGQRDRTAPGTDPMTYLPGDRVTFISMIGDLVGTVEELHGDDVYSVRPVTRVADCTSSV